MSTALTDRRYRVQCRTTGLFLLLEWDDDWDLQNPRSWWVTKLEWSTGFALEGAREAVRNLDLSADRYKNCLK